MWAGLDFGTSGARLVVIDASQIIQGEWSVKGDTTRPERWLEWLRELFDRVPLALRQQLQAIAIDGTSGTLLLCDAQGQPMLAPLLYHDGRGRIFLDTIAAIAPANHVVQSATSALAKAFWFQSQPQWSQSRYLLHQADWLAAQLHGQWGISDYHNALKLGVDPLTCAYPEWFPDSLRQHAPQVVAPGRAVAAILPAIAQSLAINPDCLICAGTTDSLAAFIATGARSLGDAVTSLGSTLALKLLCDRKLENAAAGIYSHRYGDAWLVGGASNTGGAVLAHFFSPAQLANLSTEIDLTRPSPYRYIPLLQKGDRFPVNDPDLEPCLTPRPASDVDFLYGVLDSMARLEAQGYAMLAQLGAPPLRQVWTMGGGAKNAAWSVLRSRYLGVPLRQPYATAAAYGTALLAQRGGL